MRNKIIYLLQISFFILNISRIRSEFCALDDDFRRSYVGLALSPVHDEDQKPQIKIFWGNDKFKVGDEIVLLSHGEYGFRVRERFQPKTAYGTEETGIEYDFRSDESLDIKSMYVEKCKKYYVAWIRNSYIRDITCLSRQPTWMYDRRHFLGSASLADLFIPGTYHSGIYDLSSLSIWFRIARGPMVPDIQTQQSSILSQLIGGIRYIHLTVGYHAGNEEAVWWVHKNNHAVIKLDTVIDEVNTFLSNTREIVIVDIEDFPEGFNNVGSYALLIGYLEIKFGRHLLPSRITVRTPLSKIWEYASSMSDSPMGGVMLNLNLKKTPYWFPHVRNSFIQHNIIDPLHLGEYFAVLCTAERRAIQQTNASLRATFAEYNRRFFDGFNLRYPNLKTMADQTNGEITTWYHKFWYNSTNIVAVDFFESSGIVDVAIKANEFKFHIHRSKESTPNCTLPYLPSYCPLKHMINSRKITQYLVPRVASNVAEKIYDQLKDAMAVMNSNPYILTPAGKCVSSPETTE